MQNRLAKPALMSLALLLCAATLWQVYTTFQARYLRPFDNQATLFDGSQLQLPPSWPARARSAWCTGTRPARATSATSNTRRPGQPVRQTGRGLPRAVKPGSHGQLPANLTGLQPLGSLPGSEHLPPRRPWLSGDRRGHLAYFGPYSEGAVRNASNSFIEPILKALLDDRQVSASNTLAVGCYCPGQADAPVQGYPPPWHRPAHPVTTLPAPTTALSPMVTPGRMTAAPPIHIALVTGRRFPASLRRTSGSSGWSAA